MSHHALTPPLAKNTLANTIRHILRKPKTTLALLGMPGIALAGPTGEVVVGGEAVITRPNSVTTHIDQITQRAAINWWTFDVAADEYVIFDQPDASAIVLNRVIGGDPSQIFGQILANGQVFLLNPQGVFFAPGATVDVQGLLASSLDMNPDDFMAGDFSLTRAENASANGNVINNGNITAGSGGYVLLAGDFVDNTGIISASAGTIALVSGNALTLDIEGDGLVNFAVNEATLSDIAGVRNAGSLIADGGRIIMTAQVANNLMSTVVNNEGLVRAQSIEEHGGEIYLVGYGGNVANSGTLNADGVNADGGRIIVYGDQDVTLADGGVQTAAGDENHEGGFMRFIAEDHLDYQADNLIRATGGVSGGFVEVSGHGSILLRGIPQIGAGGHYLIDPTVLRFGVSGSSSVDINQIETILQSGVDVTIVATDSISAETGSLSAASPGGGDLTIGIGTVSNGTGSCGGAANLLCTGGVVFNQTGSGPINLSNLAISIGGNLLIDAGSGTVTTTSLLTTGGNINVFGNTISTGLVDASGNIVLGSSLRTAGDVTVNGSMDAGGNVDVWTNNISGNGISISGSVTAGNDVTLHAVGSSGATPAVNIGGAISAGGNIDLTAIGTSIGGAGNINIGSGALATGAITMTASAGGGNNGGNITISTGGISAGGLVNLNATGGTSHGGNINVTGAAGITGNGVVIDANASGFASVMNNAVITITGPIQGGAGSVNISANQAGPGVGGNVNVGSISAGQISITAAGQTIGEGVINFGGPLTTTAGDVVLNMQNSAGGQSMAINSAINAAGNVFLNMQGVTGTRTLFVDADISATGGNIGFGSQIDNLSFGTGSYTLTAGNSIAFDGQFNTNGVNANYVADNNVTLTAPEIFTGNITAGNAVTLTGSGATFQTVGNVSAAHINMHFTPSGAGSLNITLGNLTATGTTPGNRDVVVSIDGGSGSSTANTVTIGNVTATNGDVSLTVFDGAPAGATGNLSIGSINAGQFINLYAPGDITAGAMTVNNISAPGNVFIDAAGNITINGGITVSGVANSGNPEAAVVDIHTSASSGSITVTGPIDVNATGANYTFSGSLEGGDSGSFSSTGNLGIGRVQVAAFGAVNLGNVSVDAVGHAFVEVSAENVTTGNITANVADGDFTRVSNLFTCDSMSCTITRTETMTSGGNAEVLLGMMGGTGSGTLNFGNIDLTAGSARFEAGGFPTISGGGITINATGNDFAISSTGNVGSDPIDYDESHLGGGATVNLETNGSGGAIVLSGAVDLSAPGNAVFRAMADTLTLQGIDVAATAGTFTRSGEPIFDDNGGPFGDEGEGGGPRIDEGTFTGGGATVSLGGYSPSFGTQNANNVTVNGNVNLSGAGLAAFNIRGDAVTVTGNTVLTSTTMTRNGTFADSYIDSLGDFIQESGTVSGNWGNVDLDVSGSGDMQFGNITLSGPMASGRVEGVNVTVGAVSVTATGGTLSVQETSSVNSASTKEFSFAGPNLITGLALRADNALNITGDLALNAVGAGGALLFGTTIATQGIAINVTNGNYTVTDARFFSAPATAFTVGDAVLGIAGATATVNGNLSLTAAGNVNFGGAANVAGNFTVNANGSLTPAISNHVQYLNAVDSEDSDAAIVLPGAFNIQATNITLTATAGALDIRNAQLAASQVMSLTAGTNLLMEAATLNAGAMEMDVGGAVDDGDGLLASLVAVAPITTAITANSLAVVAGGAIDLDNTAMNIGSGAALGVTGDADLLALLSTHGLAPASATPNAYFAGTNVSLGELTLGGDYLFVAAETFSLASFTGSNPDTLVQLTALSPTASIGIEDTVPNSSAVNFLNSDTFSQFAGMTIAVGDSQLAGNINIGENGDIDVGSTNFFVVTDGVIIGMDKILSTGIIGNLGVLLSNVFDVPQSDEIDVTLDTFGELSNDYALEDDDDDEEGDEEGEDTDDESGSEGDDDSLIRQDTVDEELVCS